MTFYRMILLVTASLALTACRSDPIQFHTLTPIQPLPRSETGWTEVSIESIRVPPQVDRQQIVIRQSDSGLEILDVHWWGASLSEELSSALAQQLSTNRARGRVSLRIDVLRFDSIPGQYALIDVQWRLRDSQRSGSLNVRCRSILQTAAGVSIDELVIAHQNNLRRLADQIGEAVGSNATPKCHEINSVFTAGRKGLTTEIWGYESKLGAIRANVLDQRHSSKASNQGDAYFRQLSAATAYRKDVKHPDNPIGTDVKINDVS